MVSLHFIFMFYFFIGFKPFFERNGYIMQYYILIPVDLHGWVVYATHDCYELDDDLTGIGRFF